MGNFSYKLDVKLDPAKGSPGTQVTLTANLSDVSGGNVKAVYMSVPEGNIWEQLPRREDGSYGRSVTVPYEAPPGTYQVRVYAVDEEGNRGSEVSVPFTVT